MSEKTAFPLCWPDGWKRSKGRRFGRFLGKDKQWIGVGAATQRLLYEFDRMGITSDDIIISTNLRTRLDGLPRSDQPKPGDPGVAIYWQTKQHGMRCIATDQYTEVADNLAAIAATLEAMRAIERHGGAEILDRAFKGFAALPERATQHWREVLGIQGQATPELIQSRYRALVKVHHPDAGGDAEKFQEITQAREAAELEIASTATCRAATPKRRPRVMLEKLPKGELPVSDPETIICDLRHTLSQQERVRTAEDLARELTTRAQAQKLFAVAKKAHEGNIEKLDQKIAHLARLLCEGWEYRDVPCKILYNSPREGEKTIVRLDTGEVLVTEAMVMAEMQGSLLVEQPPVEGEARA